MLLEALLPSDLDRASRVCLAGARARPSEDVGVVGGYEDLLAVLADPTHEEHDSMLR